MHQYFIWSGRPRSPPLLLRRYFGSKTCHFHVMIEDTPEISRDKYGVSCSPPEWKHPRFDLNSNVVTVVFISDGDLYFLLIQILLWATPQSGEMLHRVVTLRVKSHRSKLAFLCQGQEKPYSSLNWNHRWVLICSYTNSPFHLSPFLNIMII